MVLHLFRPAILNTLKKSNYVLNNINLIENKIHIICQLYDRKILLTIIRKIPFEFIKAYHQCFPIKIESEISHLIFNRSALLATNYILVNSALKRPSLNQNIEIIKDSFRLLTLCSAKLIAESIATGYNLSRHGSFNDVANFIQREHSFNVDDLCDGNNPTAVVELLSLNTLPFGKSINVHMEKTKADAELCLVNYFPCFINAKSYFEKYNYLGSIFFKEIFGITFSDFFTCFTILNKYITSKIANWEPDKPFIIRDDTDMEKLRFLFHLTESGLILIEKSELLRIHQQFESDVNFDTFNNFVNAFTFKELDDINFVEQPALFYDFGDGKLLWDVARHSGLWKSLSHKVSQNGGKAGNIKGEAFEDYIANQLQNLQIQALKRNVILYTDAHEKLMDIDIGFVHRQVLYLVELKSWVRKKGEYLGRFEKVYRAISVIRKYDKKLRANRNLIYKEWEQYNFDKAIYVLIWDEAQFIPLEEKSLWLIVGEIPRICTIEEFIRYIVNKT